MEKYSSKRGNYRWTSKEESDQLKITAKKKRFSETHVTSIAKDSQGFSVFGDRSGETHLLSRQASAMYWIQVDEITPGFSIPSPWWHGFERRVVSFHFISSEKLIPKPNKWDKSNQNPGCRKFNSQSCLSCLHRVGMVSKREKGHSPLWHLKKSWNTPLACFEKLFGVAIEQCKYSFVRMFFSIQFSFSETHHITSPS